MRNTTNQLINFLTWTIKLNDVLFKLGFKFVAFE